MNVYKDINNLPQFTNAVVTIGSFDGVHLGHKKLVKKIKSIANKIDGEDVVVTFHPHPRSIIFPYDKSLKILTDLDEKLFLLEEAGVSNVVIVPFTIEFSQQSPKEYIEKFIIESFHPAYLIVGYDHKFGLNRKGDYNLLSEYQKKGVFNLIQIDKEEIDDIGISSTKVRNYLSDGDMSNANYFLGYEYSIKGKVVHGEKIGTSLGFPTANIKLSTLLKVVPKIGIYAVKISHDDEEYDGMLYIGNRPSISSNGQTTIEVNIFNFDQTIYGDILVIKFIHFIRDDIKFNDLIDLKRQLKLDKAEAIRLMANSTSKKKDPKTAIVILNYNGIGVLQEYLNTLVLSTDKFKCDIIVIDNASTDESIKYLNEHHPKVRLITLDKNYGYAGGYNKGLSSLNYEYFALVNSDIEATENWLIPLISQMEEDTSIGCIQPKILSITNPQSFEYAGAAGGYIDILGYPFCRGRVFDSIEEDNNQYDDNKEVAWVSGAAFVIRKSLFEEFEGFDADYFAHQEEIDFCLRIRKAGYKCIASGNSSVYHLGGGTLSYESPKKTFLNFRNNLLTVVKTFPVKSILFIIPLRLILDGIAGIKFLLEGKWRNTIAIIKAHLSFYLWIPSILKKRKILNRTIKLTTIGSPRSEGNYKKSILVQYYFKKHKLFSDLDS